MRANKENGPFKPKSALPSSKPFQRKPVSPKRPCLIERKDLLNKPDAHNSSFSFNKSINLEEETPEKKQELKENRLKTGLFIQKMQDFIDLKCLEATKLGFLGIYEKTARVEAKLNKTYAQKYRELGVKKRAFERIKAEMKPKNRRKKGILNEKLSIFIRSMVNNGVKEETAPKKEEYKESEESEGSIEDTYQQIPIPFEIKSEYSRSSNSKSQNSQDPKLLVKPSLKDLELRALQRRENNRKIKEKHQEIVEKKKMEKIMEEEKQKEEDRIRKMEEIAKYKQKKQEEKEANERKIAEKTRKKHLLKLAFRFKTLNLLGKFGMNPWKLYLKQQKTLEKKATMFYKVNLRKALLSKLIEAFSLVKIERNIIEAKNIEKAKNLYISHLKKKLIVFLKRHLQFRRSYEANFENIREEFLKRTVFSRWFMKIPIFRAKNKKKNQEYEKIIMKFRLMVLGERALKAWKMEVANMKKEYLMKKDIKTVAVVGKKRGKSGK